MARRVLKWAGMGAGVLLALVIAAVGAVFGVSASRASTRYTVEVAPIEVPTDAESLAEGARLYRARGCAECHGADGRGRVILDDAPGRFVASNISGTTLSVTDFARAVRDAVAPDGRPLIFMPSDDFTQMRDEEVGKLYAHVKTLPRVENPSLPECEVRLLGRVLHVTGAMRVFPAETIDHDCERAPEPAPTAEYGEYLAHGCMGCHGEHLSGGPIPGAPVDVLGIPPNLTPGDGGIADWTEADLRTLLRTGVRKDGSNVHPDQMPWRTFQAMTDLEITALYAHLHALPPRPFGQR